MTEATNSTNGYINIAVDGPAGSGKSTLAKLLANSLGYVYIDTGALYRTIGYYIYRKGVASDDEENIVKLLPEIDISMKLVNGAGVVFLDGKPVGDEIRTSEMSVYASNVSKIPQVREFLLHLQKDIAANNNVVMDGRDIGTVVLPHARVKIFLVANDESRIKRRYSELSAKGDSITEEQVRSDMLWRDKNDSQRKIAPAIPAKDAVLLDNSLLDREQTLEAALRIVKEKLGGK